MSEEVHLEAPGVPRARMMLQRARWAASAFERYDARRVARIVEAVAEAGHAQARHFAEWAVQETGFGVVEHKVLKNEACSRGLAERFRGQDFVSPRVDASRKLVELPRPAGVVLGLVPSTNPVATIYAKTLFSLMTRNAIVISPHPLAKGCCVDAVRVLADAAVRAGAPDGCIQVVEEPSIPLINALMTDETTDVIVATGGSAVVRAAYRSGNPAIGVGPGNVPVLVDATADVAAAARLILDSKAFDNSILCTNESVLIVEERVADALVRHLTTHGGHVCSADEVDKVRAAVYPEGRMRLEAVGKDAQWIAREAGIRVGPKVRVLVTPIELVVPEEALAHEKLFPVLALVRVADARRGIDTARSVLRITGAGHSASIHSADARTVMAFGAAVDVNRVSVNVGNSLGASGFLTHLPPTMTIGTGFAGRSSLGENLGPEHLVTFTRVAYNADASIPFGDFAGLDPWAGELPRAPEAHVPVHRQPAPAADDLREEIRRVVVEELRHFVNHRT